MVWIALHYVAVLAVATRVLLRPHRDPSARVAWLAVLFSLPVVGVVAYLLLGETSIGRQRVARQKRILAALPPPELREALRDEALTPPVPDRYAKLFSVGRSISGYDPVGGNRARLMKDSDAATSCMRPRGSRLNAGRTKAGFASARTPSRNYSLPSDSTC